MVATRQAAGADPSGFVAFPELMVIDEIQRAPELLLAIKEVVDTDPRPGRYLLTGSARVLGLRVLPDVLPGRTETIELWPFSQGEMTWSRQRVELSHYRTKDKIEVDAVLEDRAGRVVGIEGKAASSVRAEDFRGLRHLADRLGDFLAGIVLYTGTQTLPFGPRLRAMPVSSRPG